jgi:hypothetical protein
LFGKKLNAIPEWADQDHVGRKAMFRVKAKIAIVKSIVRQLIKQWSPTSLLFTLWCQWGITNDRIFPRIRRADRSSTLVVDI